MPRTASASTRGAAAGSQTTIGVTAGLGFYATLSLIGFSAILIEYQWLALMVRVCGGLYDAMPLWVMTAMIGLVVVSSLTWYTIVSLFMSSRPVISRFQHARHWIERAAGVCFITIGGKVLADSRNPTLP